MKREILGYPVATVEDIYGDEQLLAREFWHQANDPDSGDPDSGVNLKHPGGFAIFNGERLQIRQLAPRLGQHNREVYENDLGLSSPEIAQLQTEGVI
jgi:formyl-CoA transferase